VLPVALLGLVLVTAGVAPQAQRPVVIVEDALEIRRVVGAPIDRAFTPTQAEAEAPRRELPHHLVVERAHEKGRDRRERLQKIYENRARYVWHCGGYEKDDERFLYCTFVSIGLEIVERKTFPVIDDGGIGVCNLTFRLKTGKIVRLDWNGEA
jgi:hypothetical protein